MQAVEPMTANSPLEVSKMNALLAIVYGQGGGGSSATYWVVVAIAALVVIAAAVWLFVRRRDHRTRPTHDSRPQPPRSE